VLTAAAQRRSRQNLGTHWSKQQTVRMANEAHTIADWSEPLKKTLGPGLMGTLSK